MDVSREQAGSKSRWGARQPLLFGLAAVGGVGLYSAVQMADQPQDDDKSDTLASPPRQDLAAPAPAPDFGPVAAAAAESPIGDDAVVPLRPAYPAKVSLAAVAERSARQSAQPPVSAGVGMTRIHSARRHTGSFEVPTGSEVDFASSAGLAMSQVPEVTSQSAAPSAPQPMFQAAAITAPAMTAMATQPESLMEAQATPRSFAPADQTAATAMIAVPPETGLQQSAARSLLPEVDTIAVPMEPAAEQRPVATSRLVPPQPQAAQPGAAARIAAVKPVPGAESSLALALPVSRSGIEGLAGLDDSRLAEVRPIAGEALQQAASAKRRGSAAGVVRPSARRQTVEEVTPSPDKISATGSGRDVHVPARINDSLMGNLPMQIAADGTVSLRLGDLLALVEGRMDQPLFNKLYASSAADSQVSLAMLRAAGMPMRYEPARNQLVLEVSKA